MPFATAIVPTTALRGYGYACVALNCVVDQIKAVLDGMPYVDNLTYYVQSVLMHTSLIKDDYGLITDFHAELIREIRIYLGELDADPNYQGVLQDLMMYVGRPYTILGAFEWGITLRIEV